MEKVMYYADIAEDYYNVACPEHVQNGYEKNVLIDTETEECLFVPGEVTPQEGELLFRCRRTKGNTVITLKTPKKERIKSYPKYKGIVREADPQKYGHAEFVSLPPEISDEIIQGVKLDNMDEFLDATADVYRDSYKCPYEVLHELDEEVVNADDDSLMGGYCVAYKRKSVDSGYYCFYFSHFEMIESKIFAVYYYGGSAG